MKIAVAFENGNVCPHFGHAPVYRIFETSEKTITGSTDHQSPGHVPGALPRWLSELKADVIIAGGMGPKAEELFEAAGIKVVIGVEGPAEKVVKEFLEGTLSCGQSSCGHVTGEGQTEHHH
jgi:predicted Fe-Mo cluster-binding NifX family protein